MKLKVPVHRVRSYTETFLKWTVLGLALGVICGAVGAAFHHAVELAGGAFGSVPWLVYLLPVNGLVIVFLYRRAGVLKDRGTNLVIQSVRYGRPASFRAAPLIFAATALTHLGGGSVGREGAALQIGAGLASLVSRLFKMEEKDTRTVTMCGMAGLFAAVFGTPITAAVFSLEVGTVGVLRYAALYPCLVTSLVAWEVSHLLGGHAVRLTMPSVPEESILALGQVVVLTLLCALCSILFLTVMHKVEHLFQHKIENPYLRVVVGGVILALLTTVLGTRDYNGAGMAMVEAAVAGETVPWAFLMKILFTALTISAGFKGGEIVPTFFIGATFGCAVGPLLGLHPGFAAGIGMVALFCCVVNCPLASILLASELFGGQGMVFFALACALSYLMSGYYTLYAEQKIVYSKLMREPKE